MKPPRQAWDGVTGPVWRTSGPPTVRNARRGAANSAPYPSCVARLKLRAVALSGSISYANSALMIDPDNAEAKKLLKQARDAREQAMKGISVN